MSEKKYKIAILGATGNVGRLMLEILEQRNFPYESIKLLASTRSAGEEITSPKGVEYIVEPATHDSFDDIDIVFASAGSSVSNEFAKTIVDQGGVLIDNSSVFRMDDDVPLVVPEVNGEDVAKHQGIIANPNCSTAPLVLALKPLDDKFKLKRVVVSTYQSVSGAGKAAMDELTQTTNQFLNDQSIEADAFQHQIAFNLIPHIDSFMDNGYTKEEMKLINETRKMLHRPDLAITCTAVRVPVYISHAESINMEFENPCSLDEIRQVWANTESLEIVDDPSNNSYPMPIGVAGQDPIYVGRLRVDESQANAFNFWLVSDNLRIGAALNTVKIGEALVNSLAISKA